MTLYQQKQIVLMRQMENSLAKNTAASTIVTIQKDYVNDPQLCLTCVSFLPKNIAETIQTQQLTKLAAIEPAFYYYPVQSLHVTIQNIRVINNPPHFSSADIAKAQQLLQNFIPAYKPFVFEFSGILLLPTSLAIIALITPEYDHFVRAFRQTLISAGIPDDKQYFTDEVIFANTTVCRYTHEPSQRFLDEVKKHESMFFGSMTAKEVSLIQTNAGAHPSKTKVLGTYQFRQN